MRIDRYTQKMQEALQAAQDLASQLNNSEITNEHFLSALLNQSDGIARPLLEKIGANVDQLQQQLRSDLERRPKIHGSATDLRMSNELRSVLDSTEVAIPSAVYSVLMYILATCFGFLITRRHPRPDTNTPTDPAGHPEQDVR